MSKKIMDITQVMGIGFVIAIQTEELGQCYLGDNDGTMSNLRSAKIYHDENYADYDLHRIINKYKNTTNSFFNDSTKLSIKKVKLELFE